ncbi:spore gernimation protein GerPD [Sutcliffiella horikoshii]|uniref:Spore gernimation protein GerPD n=1 Tax=Sutcliffiella horikoshii TaxID=79883 RepID=A0A5D4SQR3_9BACI|nr:spore gernimation protein GerPD [Sutcliffiella horikoshii]TYS65650.1 spore gernimation protein GerPD [Sutcliffiella horikoshii]
MNFQVSNHNLQVDKIDILGVSSSSIFLVGDTQNICLTSYFDTPPEALIIGPFVPLSTE